jgi:hypothetical protein
VRTSSRSEAMASALARYSTTATEAEIDEVLVDEPSDD